MSETNISWCDCTWNPFVGCTKTSPACVNCYAETQAARIVKMMRGHGKSSHYESAITLRNGAPAWSGAIVQASEKSRFAPLSWRKPRDVFVGSMTDFWHPGAARDWQFEALAVAALTPHIRYLFLTKRARDMRVFMSDPGLLSRVADIRHGHAAASMRLEWPLPNIALGVTAEDQKRADERIPELLATPAAWRFVSCEPLLGPIDITWALSHPVEIAAGFLARGQFAPGLETLRPLDWIIAGGESGPNARPTHPSWFRSLRDQCTTTATAFHFKQWGEWVGASGDISQCRLAVSLHGGAPFQIAASERARQFDLLDRCQMIRVGTRRAGHVLDGSEHRDRLPHRSNA